MGSLTKLYGELDEDDLDRLENERRANAMLALVIAHQEIDNMSDGTTEHMSSKERNNYHDQILSDYNAAIAEYEKAHAPTADEIKAHLLKLLGANG